MIVSGTAQIPPTKLAQLPLAMFTGGPATTKRGLLSCRVSVSLPSTIVSLTIVIGTVSERMLGPNVRTRLTAM